MSSAEVLVSLNRTQRLVVGFLLVLWIGVALLLAVAPEAYERALRLPSTNPRVAGLAFFDALEVAGLFETDGRPGR